MSLEAIDSYFEYVTARMLVINSARQMVGISDASDWPPKQVVMEAFYLLVVGERTASSSFWSPAVPVVTDLLQWQWLIAGTDLTKGQVGRSRGDRYRTNTTMRSELRKASWPWWAPKKSWAVIGNTPSGLALQGTAVSPAEQIWFGPLSFTSRVDKVSGSVYGVAAVNLSSMEVPITA